jgi:hypothetical protein
MKGLVDSRYLTSSACSRTADSSRHREAFLLRGVLPGLAFTAPGLTDSPQAVTASPAAKMFLAALISRSWTTPHSGHIQERISKVKEFGAFFLLGEATLGTCQLLLILVEERGIAHGLTSRQDHHGLQARVKSHLLVHYWQELDVFFYQSEFA